MNITLTITAIVGLLTLIIGILVKLLGFPHQFYNNYKRKSTKGLSTILIGLTFLAYILWTIHGLLQKDFVLVFGQGIGIITTGLIMGQIIYYKKK